MKKFLPWILAVAFFVIGVMTLSDYGMHEDSPFHFLRGQYYLERILGRSGQFNTSPVNSPVMFIPGQLISAYKPNASEELSSPLRPIIQNEISSLQNLHKESEIAVGHRFSFYESNAWTANVWEHPSNQGHPAVSDMLMAGINRLTYGFLGILPDVEGYQIYTIIVISLSLAFLYLFVADAFGPVAALIAVLTLALYPMVWAESHFNIKDPVQMGFFTMAITSWYFTVTRKLSIDWLVLTIISVFLALGTKWNILFAPLILLPWTIFVIRTFRKKSVIPVGRLLLFCIIVLIVPFVLLILAYPSYWTDTADKLLSTLNYYVSFSVKDLRVEQPSTLYLPGGLDATAVLYFLSMSPPVMILLGFVGTLGLLFSKYASKYRAGLLVALWFIIPFIRVIWQTSDVFGSMRNYMEFLPAFAVLVGVGSAWILNRLKKYVYLIIFLCVFILIHGAILVRFHPYEHLYFNSFVGGIRGAQSIGLFSWVTVYDAPYRQLANWLNDHAEKDAKVAYLDGTMIALSPTWLRGDIRIGSYFSGFEGKGEYIASLAYQNPPEVFQYKYLEKFVKPVYEINVDGVTIAKIWKNDAVHTVYSGTPKNITASLLKIQTSVFRGADRTNVALPLPMQILKVGVTTDDIRCITGQNFVWSIVDGTKETYMVPLITQISDSVTEVLFPGATGSNIRFWDVEHTGCAGKIRVLYVEGLK